MYPKDILVMRGFSGMFRTFSSCHLRDCCKPHGLSMVLRFLRCTPEGAVMQIFTFNLNKFYWGSNYKSNWIPKLKRIELFVLSCLYFRCRTLTKFRIIWIWERYWKFKRRTFDIVKSELEFRNTHALNEKIMLCWI